MEDPFLVGHAWIGIKTREGAYSCCNVWSSANCQVYKTPDGITVMDALHQLLFLIGLRRVLLRDSTIRGKRSGDTSAALHVGELHLVL